MLLYLRRSKEKQVLTCLIIYTVFAYFVYHALHGERGIISYLNLTSELNEKYAALESIAMERIRIEKRVALMRKSSVDLDLLEELARKELGLAEVDEKVLIMRKE